MDASTNGPIKQANARVEWVWFSGTDALREGEGVCYDTNYGVAANRDCRRNNHVKRPSASNNKAFAGVVARDYAASATGQFVEIYTPGSRGVNVALGVDTVIDTGILTFQVGGGSAAGRFVKAGFKGRGSIVPRQTVTAVLEASMTGAWSLAADGITLTVVATAGLAAGDTVVLLGGANDGTGAIVPGKYVIASITNGTTLVLTASAVTAATGALTCTGYAFTGNPRCQADLLEGEESGGIEFISPPNAGGDTLGHMAGGVTYVCGGVTLAADSECELAAGTQLGERKGFVCLGTMTTSDFVVDLVANGITLAGGALAEVNAIDAANDAAYLEWVGLWRTLMVVGGAAEA